MKKPSATSLYFEWHLKGDANQNARLILECRKEDAGREIEHVGRGARANKAYGSKRPPRRSKLVDNQG